MKKQIFLMAGAFLFLGALLCVAQAEEPKQEGKFFGKIFFDYFHDFSSTDIDPARISPAGQKNGFEFTRIYFGYDRDIAENFSIRFLMDADFSKEYKLEQVGSNAIVNTDGDTINIPNYQLKESSKGFRPFLKNAYLAINCKLIKGSKWYIGMIGMPFVGVPESHWGYRSLYKLPMDQAGWGNTADIGIGWKGMWQERYQVEFAVANGAGFKNPEADMFKLIELRPTAYLMEKAITVSVLGSYEALNDSSNALIVALMAGYDHKLFRIGGEYSIRSTSKGYIDSNGDVATKSENNLSFWLHAKAMEKLTFLGRYDLYEPNTDVEKDKTSALIVGLDFRPAKNVHFIPNVQMQMNEKDDVETTDYNESASQNTFYVTFEYGW